MRLSLSANDENQRYRKEKTHLSIPFPQRTTVSSLSEEAIQIVLPGYTSNAFLSTNRAFDKSSFSIT